MPLFNLNRFYDLIFYFILFTVVLCFGYANLTLEYKGRIWLRQKIKIFLLTSFNVYCKKTKPKRLFAKTKK